MVWAITLVAALTLAFSSMPASAKLARGDTSADQSAFRDCADCPEMVPIPSGSFIMGSSRQERDREQVHAYVSGWEQPQREVTIARPFAIGRFEITRVQFAKFARETGHSTGSRCKVYFPAEHDWREEDGYNWRRPGFLQTGEHPVVCVSFADASQYVEWLSKKTGKRYRLPSQAEFEYATRGGTATARYWGDSLDGACVYANVVDQTRVETDTKFPPDMVTSCRDGFVRTAPVGSFRPNNFGLYDMIGNVWEFNEDCASDDHTVVPINGSPYLLGDCKFRTLSGGSYGSRKSELRAAQRGRGGDPQTYRADYLGFRVAREL